MMNEGFKKYLESKRKGVTVDTNKKGTTVNTNKKVVQSRNASQAKSSNKHPGKVSMSWNEALAALKARYGKH